MENIKNREELTKQINDILEKKPSEIPKPLGHFIMDNAKGIMLEDGMYYHYTEVINLLRLMRQANEK